MAVAVRLLAEADRPCLAWRVMGLFFASVRCRGWRGNNTSQAPHEPSREIKPPPLLALAFSCMDFPEEERVGCDGG